MTDVTVVEGVSASARLQLHAFGTSRTINNFACQHLMAASTFRDRATEVEHANVGKPFGGFYNEIRSYVSGTIMSAAASLEALINEFFIADGSALRKAIGPNFHEQYWGKKGIEKKGILEKYEIALEVLGAEALDTNCQAYSDVKWLIELRNALVHFKPIWDFEHRRTIELKESFKDRFELSPFMTDVDDFLGLRCMSAGCAAWCVDSVLSFLRIFDERAHIGDGKMAGFWLLERSST